MRDSPDHWDATFWDIGGVIVDLDSVGTVQRAFIESLLQSRSVDTSVTDALDTWRQAVGEYFRQREGTEFYLAEEAYHRGVESVLGGPVAKSEWRPLFDEAFTEHIEPMPGAVSTLEAVAERRIHVGVVSDIDDREADAVLEAFGLESVFDSVTTSEGVGRTKPDRRMFESALDEASVSANRSLMIGDRYRHDIEGASEVGLWTVAYGADSGPAIDFHIEQIADVVDILDGGV